MEVIVNLPLGKLIDKNYAKFCIELIMYETDCNKEQAEDIYVEFMDRHDCTSIFDLKKVIGDRR